MFLRKVVHAASTLKRCRNESLCETGEKTVTPITTTVLGSNNENQLIEFMNRDRLSNFFTFYDLKHMRDKTKTWIALSNNKIVGYLLEYDNRVLQLRGQRRSAIPLVKNLDLTTPLFNIEPKHLSAIRGLYKPTEPADSTTVGLMTTFIVMKTTPQTFTPIIRHRVQELKKENARELGELFGAEPERTLDLLKGVAFGIFEDKRLVSCAASPDILEDLAIIRGVKTVPDERNKGYSTSVCSALVRRMHQLGKETFLYVSKDNSAALKVYRKIGFRETGHAFFSFLARRKNQTRTNQNDSS